MNKRLYRILLVLLLIIVLASIYFQFTTFGTDQYWIFFAILVLAWIASRLLKKQAIK